MGPTSTVAASASDSGPASTANVQATPSPGSTGPAGSAPSAAPLSYSALGARTAGVAGVVAEEERQGAETVDVPGALSSDLAPAQATVVLRYRIRFARGHEGTVVVALGREIVRDQTSEGGAAARSARMQSFHSRYSTC